MNQKKHLNADAALEASKDAEKGKPPDYDKAMVEAHELLQCDPPYDDEWQKDRRAWLARWSFAIANGPESPAPLIPDPPDTSEVREIMEHLARPEMIEIGCNRKVDNPCARGEMDHCGECAFYHGEECGLGPNEGSERYDDSPACEVFKASKTKEGGEG
jgi:hypothetical protein